MHGLRRSSLAIAALCLIGGRLSAAEVGEFLTQHCVRCHGPKLTEGKLRLDELAKSKLDDVKASEIWPRVLEQLATGNMPPEGEPRPPREQVERAVIEIHDALLRTAHGNELRFPDKGNHIPHGLLFGPEADLTAKPASPARIWRLAPHQYQALTGPLSGDGYKPGRTFTAKQNALPLPFSLRGGPGLQDYSDLYRIDEAQTEQLVLNARELARRMFSGEGKARPPKTVADIAAATGKLTDEQVARFVNEITKLVLHRPPTDEERTRYIDFVRRETERHGNTTGLQNGLAAVLLHPAAMFRMELGTGPTDEFGRTLLGPLEMAHAVAFALTDSPPDSRMMEFLRSGRLQTREDVRREVTRLLGDARITRTPIARFFHEYFGHAGAPDVFKDDDLLRPEVRQLIVNDTDRLIQLILEEDRQVLRELLTTERSFVYIDALRNVIFREQKAKGANHPFYAKNRINEVYSLAADDWREEQPLTFAGQRAGILTQPSWLIAHSTNDANDAIHRGKWIRERLLGGAIPDVPITVQAQLPDEPTATLRERMRVTREEFCWQCHKRMDPLGLAFEQFDHWGRFRTEELGKPVDTQGAILDSPDPKLNGPVKNSLELVRRLAESEYVEQVFVRHAFRFWMGRNETPQDAPTLQAAWRAYHDNDGSFNAMLTSLLTSDSFLYRRK
jgi:hypothetical protein